MWICSHSYVKFAIALWTLTCACEANQGSIPFNKWKMWHSYVRIPCHYVTFFALPGHKCDIAMSQWHNCAHRCMWFNKRHHGIVEIGHWSMHWEAQNKWRQRAVGEVLNQKMNGCMQVAGFLEEYRLEDWRKPFPSTFLQCWWKKILMLHPGIWIRQQNWKMMIQMKESDYKK